MKEEKKITCPDCDGTKEDQMNVSMLCPFCDGEGIVTKDDIKGTIFEKEK